MRSNFWNLVVALALIVGSVLDYIFWSKDFYETGRGFIEWIEKNPPNIMQVAVFLLGIGYVYTIAHGEGWLPWGRYSRTKIEALRATLEPMARIARLPNSADAQQVLQTFREAAGDFESTSDLGPDIRALESNVTLLVGTADRRHIETFGINPERDAQRMAAALDAVGNLLEATKWVIYGD